MSVLKHIEMALGKLAEVPAGEFEHFSTLLKRKSVKKGEFVFTQGDTQLELGFLLKGLLHSYYQTHDGKIVTKNFVWEGRMSGAWTSILQGNFAAFSCEALEDSEILAIDANEFLNLKERHVCWINVARAYTEKLLIEREVREYNSLVMSTKDQYLEFKKNFEPIFNRIPQYLVASYIGVNEVTLSRAVKK